MSPLQPGQIRQKRMRGSDSESEQKKLSGNTKKSIYFPSDSEISNAEPSNPVEKEPENGTSEIAADTPDHINILSQSIIDQLSNTASDGSKEQITTISQSLNNNQTRENFLKNFVEIDVENFVQNNLEKYKNLILNFLSICNLDDVVFQDVKETRVIMQIFFKATKFIDNSCRKEILKLVVKTPSFFGFSDELTRRFLIKSIYNEGYGIINDQEVYLAELGDLERVEEEYLEPIEAAFAVDGVVSKHVINDEDGICELLKLYDKLDGDHGLSKLILTFEIIKSSQNVADTFYEYVFSPESRESAFAGKDISWKDIYEEVFTEVIERNSNIFTEEQKTQSLNHYNELLGLQK